MPSKTVCRFVVPAAVLLLLVSLGALLLAFGGSALPGVGVGDYRDRLSEAAILTLTDNQFLVAMNELETTGAAGVVAVAEFKRAADQFDRAALAFATLPAVDGAGREASADLAQRALVVAGDLRDLATKENARALLLRAVGDYRGLAAALERERVRVSANVN